VAVAFLSGALPGAGRLAEAYGSARQAIDAALDRSLFHVGVAVSTRAENGSGDTTYPCLHGPASRCSSAASTGSTLSR